MKMRFRHGWAWAMIWLSMNWLLVSHHSSFPTGKKLQSSQVRSILQSVIHSSLLTSFFMGIPPTPSQSRPPTKNKGLWKAFLPPLQPLIRKTIYIYIYITIDIFIYLFTIIRGVPFWGQWFWSPMTAVRKATNPFLRWDVPEVQQAGRASFYGRSPWEKPIGKP